MNRKDILRIRILFVVIFMGSALIGMKLYIVQVENGEMFSDKADRQYVSPNYATYNRGGIFFEDKGGELISAATLKSGFGVWMNPAHIKDPIMAFRQLEEYIDIDLETFQFRVSKKDDPYEEIARNLPTDVANTITALKIPGIHLEKQKWRYYPGGSMASHALGFVGFLEDELAGRYGIERYYDDILKRDEGEVYINFFAEVFSNISEILSDDEEHKQGNIILSIEPSVQSFLEKQLREIAEKWDAPVSGGIIINPKNGEIYAIGSYPDFDPNTFEEQEDPLVFSNPLVENVFEMGSIIKPLTMAAGLDTGVVTADSTYYDSGSIELNGAILSNYDGKGRGFVDMQTVLNKSLNTGVMHVVKKMGNDVFAQYIRDFGLGEETGIDVPNETLGLLGNLNSPRDIEYATAAFGQGIAFTPIGTVRALSVLANGGKLITPHIASRIDYRLGYSKRISFEPDRQVIKPETSEEITRMLVRVVDEALLDGKVKMDQYSIAAKTGTAQIAKTGEAGYYDDRFFHSFFGYYPAYDPIFLTFLYVSEPKGVRYASATLTIPFMDIAKFLLNYYQVPPDRGDRIDLL